MSTYTIEGSNQLEGSIKPSGSKDSAVKLLSAALLSNEDVVLENVPRTSDIDDMIKIIEAIGGSISWIGDNKISVNGSTINTHVVPFEFGSKTRFSTLLAAPLLFRFGKATLPKPINTSLRPQPINRWIDTWELLGNEVYTDEQNIYIEAKEQYGNSVNFKISTHMGTSNALLTAVFTPGQTMINNAAEESEVDDLVKFLNVIGGEVERIGPRKIRVIGRNVFTEGYFEIQPDIIETIAFATASLVTKGSIRIKGIKRLHLTSFVNFLTKIGARFDYSRDELCVWYGGEEFAPHKLESSPAPGFLADWLPYATLLLCFAHGTSYVHDTIYVDRFGFVQDLNRMGADITQMKPTKAGFQVAISDESYDYETLGEPESALEINGPVKLKGARLNMDDKRFNTMLIVAALGAEGKSELIGINEMFVRHENLFEKLISLGAVITENT